MSLLVTGSIGIDTVESPAGRMDETLGGSCVYFAYAASYFSPVRLVGVVGEDCPEGFLDPLKVPGNIDLSGVEVRPGSKTFRWHGKYHDDVNLRDTISVELNVLGERGPDIPMDFRDSRYVFLANTHPGLQLQLLGAMERPSLAVADTMDLWIETERETLGELLSKIDGVVLNDSEAKQFTGKTNIITAGREIAKLTKRFCVVKKGEHGSLLCAGDDVVVLPSWPADVVTDPTGAGDSFAGAMMGHIAAEDDTSLATLRRAIAYGTVTASLELEDFSLNKFQQISRADIDERLGQFQALMAF